MGHRLGHNKYRDRSRQKYTCRKDKKRTKEDTARPTRELRRSRSKHCLARSRWLILKEKSSLQPRGQRKSEQESEGRGGRGKVQRDENGVLVVAIVVVVVDVIYMHAEVAFTARTARGHGNT